MRAGTLILSAGFGLFLATAAIAEAPAPSGAISPAAAAVSSGLPAITVSTVASAQLVDRVRASGLIEPVERVLVQPRIEGQAIEEILVEVGDRVEEGQVLARLSDAALVLQRSQLEATRASALASIAQAEAQRVEAETVRDQALRDRDRALELAAQGATSKTAADDAVSNAATALARVTVAVQGLSAAEAQLRVVDAQIADIDLQLRRTSVVAPVAGEVSERGATIGAIASMAGEPLFAIIRDGLLELRADVAEQDILGLRIGQAARMRVAGLDAPLTGAIRLVEPTVDTATRQGRIRIAIDQPDRVRSGMFAEAVIVVTEAHGLAVPISAVAGGSTVLRVRGGLVEQVAIETGFRDGGLVEVVGGLAEGDTVVTKAGAFVRAGDRINPVPAEPAAGTIN